MKVSRGFSWCMVIPRYFISLYLCPYQCKKWPTSSQTVASSIRQPPGDSSVANTIAHRDAWQIRWKLLESWGHLGRRLWHTDDASEIWRLHQLRERWFISFFHRVLHKLTVAGFLPLTVSCGFFSFLEQSRFLKLVAISSHFFHATSFRMERDWCYCMFGYLLKDYKMGPCKLEMEL